MPESHIEAALAEQRRFQERVNRRRAVLDEIDHEDALRRQRDRLDRERLALARRSLPSAVALVRSAPATGATAGPTSPGGLDGYPVVFDVVTNIGGPELGFDEVIAPHAADRALREKHDVRLLLNHDPSRLLGRTKSGTLTLSADRHGLRARAPELPNTPLAHETVELVRRGDLSQGSFAFIPTKETWLAAKPGRRATVIIEDMDMLDVSVVTFPAYEPTSWELSADLRSVDARAARLEGIARRMEAEQHGRPVPPLDIARRLASLGPSRRHVFVLNLT